MSWERRVMAQFEAEVRRAEARAARLRSRQSLQETADEKDLRLAEQQRRLEEEKTRLGKELGELERTSIVSKADLRRQIEAVKRQRRKNRGSTITLEY